MQWCSSEMGCHENYSAQCPVENWCVCQWAFASYLHNAGGCDKIQDVVCESTNMVALEAYEAQAASSPHIADALACLMSRCSISADARAAEVHANANAEAPAGEAGTSASVPLLLGGMVLCIGVGLTAGLAVGGRLARKKDRSMKAELKAGEGGQLS